MLSLTFLTIHNLMKGRVNPGESLTGAIARHVETHDVK